MSLFEVLRYSETDLTDLEALLALPPELVLKYWLIAHSNKPDSFPENGKMCHLLARWAKSADGKEQKEYAKNKFIQALREVESLT